MQNTHNPCQILTKHESSWQILKKYCNIKFHEILSSDDQVVPLK